MNCLPCKIALAGRAVAALALLILATAVAAADLFEVRDVEVDVTADSAALARQQAIAEGERKALEILLDRLVAGEADVALPEGPQLQALIQDFSIVSEKASAVRYIATMVVRFDADAVRAWMVEQGVPFAARPSEPVVVVPVWEADNSLTLWDDPNPWREAWDESTASASLVPTRTRPSPIVSCARPAPPPASIPRTWSPATTPVPAPDGCSWPWSWSPAVMAPICSKMVQWTSGAPCG